MTSTLDPASQGPTQQVTPSSTQSTSQDVEALHAVDDVANGGEEALLVTVEDAFASASRRPMEISPSPITRRRSCGTTQEKASYVIAVLQKKLRIEAQRIQEQREDPAERFRLWDLEQKEGARVYMVRAEQRERAEREKKINRSLLSIDRIVARFDKEWMTRAAKAESATHRTPVRSSASPSLQYITIVESCKHRGALRAQAIIHRLGANTNTFLT